MAPIPSREIVFVIFDDLATAPRFIRDIFVAPRSGSRHFNGVDWIVLTLFACTVLGALFGTLYAYNHLADFPLWHHAATAQLTSRATWVAAGR